jgi:hypothetical protein
VIVFIGVQMFLTNGSKHTQDRLGEKLRETFSAKKGLISEIFCINRLVKNQKLAKNLLRPRKIT